MIETVDSYYAYIVGQMQSINSARKFGGVALAADWPQIPAQDSALYLIFINALPANAQRDGSVSEILYEHFVQWVWLVRGTDIPSTQQMANRGDRYRTHMQIISDLRQANYPGFAPKKSITVNPVTGTPTLTPVVGPFGSEQMWWSRPKYPTKADQPSGLIYGTSVLEIYAYESVSAAQATLP